MRTAILGVLLGLGSLLMLAIPGQAAAVLVVNSTNDVDDGACNAQHCSFREALLQAANTAAGERITFDDAVFPSNDSTAIEYAGPSMGFGGSWVVPDDTEVDGIGAGVILHGPGPTLSLGSRAFIHHVSVRVALGAGPTQYAIFVWSGDQNVVSDNSLHGEVSFQSHCGGGDQARGNQLLRNDMTGGVNLLGLTCGIDGTVIQYNHITRLGFGPPPQMIPTAGASFHNTSNTTFSFNIVTGTSGIHIDVGVSGLQVTMNDIVGNTPAGLTNETDVVVNAVKNWWGSASGPSGEGPGRGDAMVGPADFDPWLRRSIIAEDEREDRRPPNIGAGLSGLFAGQPTHLPTVAAAAVASGPVITPPRTGDAGLR